MKAFLHHLRQSGYAQFYGSFGDGNLRMEDWPVAARSVNGSLKDFVDLFLLGRPLPARRALPLIGSKLVAELIEAGILHRGKGRLISNTFRLVVCRSYLLFFELGMNTRAYFGEDSVALATLQSRALGGRVLDLCAGPGIQSFVASAHAGAVTGVELRKETCRVAEINCRMNGLQDRVRFVCSSLEDYAPSDRQTYDLILANPPLVPVVPGFWSPLPADGGINGLAVTERIVRLYHHRLARDGRLEFIGSGLGNTKHAGVADEIAALSGRHGLGGRLHLLSRHPIKAHTPFFEAYVQTFAVANRLGLTRSRKIITDHFVRLGFDSFWLFFCSLGRGEGTRRKPLATVDLTSAFYGGWFL
jgi:hypothetical protein